MAWNFANTSSRVAFARIIQPLITATRCKDFDDEKAKPQLKVWMDVCHDLPPELMADAVAQLLPVSKWMPKPAEVREACCLIVEQRRLAAVRQAKALLDDCPDCQGSGWANAEGPNAVERCTCAKRAWQLLAEAGQMIARPVLPPAREEEEAL
jgi:hypothetical protein